MDQAALRLDAGQGQVDQNGSEADGDEQQWFILPGDTEVDQQPGYGEHSEVSQGQGSETGGGKKIGDDPQDAHS